MRKRPTKTKSEIKKGSRGHVMGQPPFEPTDIERKTVYAMASVGVPHEMIAAGMRDGEGIDADTLKKHFKHELASGKAKTGYNVAKMLYERCKEGDTTAMIWYTKTQMKWKEDRTPDIVVGAEDLVSLLSKLVEKLPD